MEFEAAGELIGSAHRVRTVELADIRELPDGEYMFVDMYCIDPGCDCRKTIIRVYHNGKHVSTLNYGWESPAFYPAFYRRWMRRGDDTGMAGVSVAFESPDLVSQRGILSLFMALLDERWTRGFKKHYAAVKKVLAERSRPDDPLHGEGT